jgi:hypothetical protein
MECALSSFTISLQEDDMLLVDLVSIALDPVPALTVTTNVGEQASVTVSLYSWESVENLISAQVDNNIWDIVINEAGASYNDASILNVCPLLLFGAVMADCDQTIDLIVTLPEIWDIDSESSDLLTWSRWSCDEGFYDNNGVCSDEDECTDDTHTCDSNAVCSNTEGSYTCACGAGYTGDGEVCSDEDECTDDTHTCDSNAVCSNTEGSYTCACGAGYNGDGEVCYGGYRNYILTNAEAWSGLYWSFLKIEFYEEEDCTTRIPTEPGTTGTPYTNIYTGSSDAACFTNTDNGVDRLYLPATASEDVGTVKLGWLFTERHEVECVKILMYENDFAPEFSLILQGSDCSETEIEEDTCVWTDVNTYQAPASFVGTSYGVNADATAMTRL